MKNKVQKKLKNFKHAIKFKMANNYEEKIKESKEYWLNSTKDNIQNFSNNVEKNPTHHFKNLVKSTAEDSFTAGHEIICTYVDSLESDIIANECFDFCVIL